jgi:23S rRNA pseudouridine2604 synthase
MTDAARPKLKLKSGAPARDPRRQNVRNATPRPQTTLSQRDAERQARQAAFAQEKREQYADAAKLPAKDGKPPMRPKPPARSPAAPGARPASRTGAPKPAFKTGNRPDAPPRRDEAPRFEAPPRPQPPARQAPDDAGVRLSKVMSDRGLASRREADDWIDAGWVTVNGEVAHLGQRVADDARIDIDPRARAHQALRVTILLHKPIGYVSGQAEDGYEPARVLVKPDTRWAGDTSRIDFHRGHLAHLVPAGRLDIDSTGLLVLTQDGRVARHLIGEDSHIEKEYLVRVEPAREGSVHPDALRLLNHGLELDDVALKPARVSWANEDQLRFVLREGRKRQIRRMCELVGLKVTGLKRVRIGSVVLGKLPPGQWRYLAPGEKF